MKERDIYEIHGDLLDVCESLRAFNTAFGVLKEHYNVDDETELFHWMDIFQGSIKSVASDMQETLDEMDRYMLRTRKS